MSIFGSIMSKILGHPAAANAATPGTTLPTTSAANPATPMSGGAPAAGQAAPAANVDVGAILSDMAGKSGQPLNYKTSIVDLMKLLGLDSSVENRRQLATELHYPGDTNDSAAMNVWLHKQVMQKLAENGGTVPAELRT